MKFISFLFFVLAAYPISVLPFRVLYVLSDILYFNITYIFRYRRKVILQNLANAFPDMSDGERKVIMKKYYKNLSDVTLENVKMLTISRSEVLKRCKIVNQSMFDSYEKDGKSIIAVSSHYCNWELGGFSIALNANHQLLAAYLPLSNKYFDNLVNKMRKKFGAILVEPERIARAMVEHKENLTISVYIADQAPLHSDQAYWTTFLNQDTPVFTGPEKIAKLVDSPVVYLYMQRIKRGYYTIEVIAINDKPRETEENETTEKQLRVLENIIKERPENWLWSHKRWKRKRTAG
ncbi:MAG: lysophospholipid acyltransferase family protein [Bacteroidetes bacterium]|nr:lysophospholipid acyltransferase family protein [Bacteroidota bacterium]